MKMETLQATTGGIVMLVPFGFNVFKTDVVLSLGNQIIFIFVLVYSIWLIFKQTIVTYILISLLFIIIQKIALKGRYKKTLTK